MLWEYRAEERNNVALGSWEMLQRAGDIWAESWWMGGSPLVGERGNNMFKCPELWKIHGMLCDREKFNELTQWGAKWLVRCSFSCHFFFSWPRLRRKNSRELKHSASQTNKTLAPVSIPHTHLGNCKEPHMLTKEFEPPLTKEHQWEILDRWMKWLYG